MFKKSFIKNIAIIFLSLIFILSASGISSAADDKQNDDEPKLIEIN